MLKLMMTKKKSEVKIVIKGNPPNFYTDSQLCSSCFSVADIPDC